MIPSAAERFAARVVPGEGDCVLWVGSRSPLGYGVFKVGGRPIGVHRWSYEQSHGPIPDGLEIDHLCRVRNCVNPDHLEAVTHLENVRRGIAARSTTAAASG